MCGDFGQFVIIAVLLLLSTTTDGQIDNPPNILFILADDLGHANVGYHNKNGEVNTPNIDYLVSSGLELNRHYAHYVCSPTRSSLHSGRLPIHCNLYNGEPNSNINNINPTGIPSNYTLISEKLKYSKYNYSTHFIGKWHSGATLISQMPYNRGYDTSFGYLWGMNDYFTENFIECDNTLIVDLWKNNKPGNKANNTKYEEFMFAQRVYDLIENHNNKNDDDNQQQPFYIFYASHLSHSPLEIPKEYYNEYANDEYLCCNFSLTETRPNPIYPGYNQTDCKNHHCRSIYQSMVNLFDIIVGNITIKLKENNLWNNTLIIFSSDNGGQLTLNEAAANNYPLRGGKFVPFEGGIRVNAFVSGGYLPEKQRGLKTNAMMHISDWYSSICNMLDIDPIDIKAQNAGLPPIDSLNFWPVINGNNMTSPRTELIIDNITLIQNNYKFINQSGQTFTFHGCKKNEICYASWSGNLYPNTSSIQSSIQNFVINCENGCLFDIGSDTDYTEHNNIINQNTDIANKMNQRLIELRNGYYTNNENGQSLCQVNTPSCSCSMALNEYGGFWGPWRSP